VTFDVPLAWRQLRKEKRRLAAALAGVAFAVILMLVQLGFEQALFKSVGLLYSHLTADLVLISPKYQNATSTGQFTERRLYQAVAAGDIAWTAPLYLSDGMWKNPVDHTERDIFLIGVPPHDGIFDLPEVNAAMPSLKNVDTVLFDASSRPEFGPIAEELRTKRRLDVGLSGVTMSVAGTFHLGASFAVDGNVLMSDLTFRQTHPDRSLSLIDVGLIGLKPGVDAETAQRRIQAILPNDVLVLTRAALLQREQAYWAGNTPIGFVFRLGLIMGLIVGSVVVYQILYSDVSEHLAEYATLKAIGYTNRFLFGVVIQEALILSILGFLPGVALSQVVFLIAYQATLLPLRLDPVRLGAVYVLTAGMCAFSGALAMRKVKSADPADIF
jgi:putative ABC transport system permease protein